MPHPHPLSAVPGAPPADWVARFIAPSEELDGAPRLTRTIVIDTAHGAVVEAWLHLSALGIVEAAIDGIAVSEDLFTPGWTAYERRVRFARYDVTDLLRRGTHQVEVSLDLGRGWFAGRLGWQGDVEHYGSEPAGFAQLHIRFADGHEQVVGTDESWAAAASASISDSLYDGQTIDGRRLSASHVPSSTSGVRTLDVDQSVLTPYIAPPVRRVGEMRPTAIWRSPAGRTLVDFGQNLVGWVRVRVQGDAGSAVTIRHAEVLEDEELGTRPLRGALAMDTYILSGGIDVFEPTFTFHGFRYIEVTGWPGEIDAEALTAVVVSSNLRRIGTFECSDPLLNRLHENVVWSMRGNFLDVPTDCPQRDERLGWTGDIAVFAPTAAYLFDSAAFLRDWLRDLAVEQDHGDGVVPFVVPDVLRNLTLTTFDPSESTAIWSDAAVWVPWSLWWAYADRSALAEAYPAMARHVRHVAGLLSPSGVWDRGFQFGDWLDPDAHPDRPGQSKADAGVVATAAAFRSAEFTSAAARELGRPEDAREFALLAGRLRDAFHAVYVHDRRILSDCTAVYALAIAFGLLDDDERVWAGDRLAELVELADHRISTGFAGTPYIADALTATGHLATAFRLVMQTRSPSWLHAVEQGATTIWERWDSMLPDGSINPGEMTSFNHYALGAIADWIHRVVGGLSPLEPGYRRILIAPHPGGGLTWAQVRLDTPHGQASVRWELVDAGLELHIDLPPGTKGIVRLPGAGDRELAAGTHHVVHPHTERAQ